jgi:ectoine hydroxylase-related dioxygenase (phytanoyl-CoA dioxygenase family)
VRIGSTVGDCDLVCVSTQVIPGSHRASVNLDQPGSLRQQQLESPAPSDADSWSTLAKHDPRCAPEIARSLSLSQLAVFHHIYLICARSGGLSSGGLLGVVHPTMKAGDVLFFMGGATIHGSVRYPEDAPHPRRIFLTNWLSRDVNLRGPPSDGVARL